MQDVAAAVAGHSGAAPVAVGFPGGTQSEKKALQEKLDQATLVLDRVEEERDLALLELEEREDKLARSQAEADELHAQLAAAERRIAAEAAEAKRLAAAGVEGEARGEALADRRRQQEMTNQGLEIKLRRLSNRHHFFEASLEKREAAKEEAVHLLSSTLAELSRLQYDLSEAEGDAQRLRHSRGAIKDKAAAFVGKHDDKLRVAKQQNVDHLLFVQKSQVREFRAGQDLFSLRHKLAELKVQRDAIKARLETKLLIELNQNREEAYHRRDELQNTLEALKKSLATAEEQNAQLQDTRKTRRNDMGQMDDKVFALMDQVHQVQSKLCRQEQKAIDKEKKFGPLSRSVQLLQDDLEREVNARLASEHDARDSQQAKALVARKHGLLEKSLGLAVSTQQKSERRLQDLVDKANSLQIKNDFMKTLIDGNEDDKAALRYEMRRLHDKIQEATGTSTLLLQKHRSREQQLAEIKREKASLIAELDYLRREDMLDEQGRVQPILIESESSLVERLEINEFLFNAQMARKPVELMVLKISHLLEMLHRAEVQAELFLQDIERSQEMLTSLRAKNLALLERVELSFTWRQRALWRFAASTFERREPVAGHGSKCDGHVLHLDGLQYHRNEVIDLLRAIESYGQQDRVKELSLQENLLDRSCVPTLRALLEACPYLKRLDLRQNCLDTESMDLLASYAETVPGATGVEREPGSDDIRVMSGCQVRLVIALAEQREPGSDEVKTELWEEEALVEGGGEEDSRDIGASADIFLASLTGFPASVPEQLMPASPAKPEQLWSPTKRPPSSPALSTASTCLPSASATRTRLPTSPGMGSTSSSGFSTPSSIGRGIGGGGSSSGSPSAATTPLPSLREQCPRSTGKMTEIAWLPDACGQSLTSPLSPGSTRASPSSLSSTPGRSPSSPLLPSPLSGKGAAIAGSASATILPAARPDSSASSRTKQASGRASAVSLPRSRDLKRTTFTFTSDSGLVTGGSVRRWPKSQTLGGEKLNATSGIAAAPPIAAGPCAVGIGGDTCDSRVGTPSSDMVLPPLAGIVGLGGNGIAGAKPFVQPASVADDDIIDL